MNGSELQKKHFATLKVKYQVGQQGSAASDSFLYLILRKADLDIQITDLEIQWLTENRLFGAIEGISLQQYKAEENKRIEAEFWQLRKKYRIPENVELPLSSSIYPVLWKLDAGYTLADSELKLLKAQGLVETVNLLQDIQSFSKLKVKYKATQHLNQFPENPLYSILKKLDKKELLDDSEADWLLEFDFEETLEIYWQQEEQKKAELEFLELKSKYQVAYHPDISVPSSLYSILIKLENEEDLDSGECKWLKQQKLNKLIEIDEERKERKLFINLKANYKATQHPDFEISSQLFKVLIKVAFAQIKLSNLGENIETFSNNLESLCNEDINWLTKQGLSETAEIAREIYFKSLKAKYQIIGQLPIEPFYEIMLKLEREERLAPKQVIQLIEEGRLARRGKIAIAYYRLEAIFYEKEYQRTGNKWNLPSASSNWRKADQPEKALQVTKNVDWTKIREADLKSALLVTRGAAFRDLEQLDEAETCAVQATECQPESHQPYTLRGAICYDRREYEKGDVWFEMAAERGADDTDDEIERIVRMTKDKDKRREVVEYLLSKDPQRYAWAKSYLK
ncbi:hypothetical protein [Coleofasciculus sp. FACHB-129]|uniref:hypothetical protein n=1 Tax=Cyanophyceae TaxID=3028117 RepID=UPI001689DC63|nr:hypothetical protein [Coleofasciculus sp. FACHB-129]MBD1898330.1 hypothetical protein [Coleofasciculus sp. FACHB-129]